MKIKNEICEKYNNIKNIRTYHCSDYKTCIINGLFIVFVQKKKSYILFIFYGGINSLINSLVILKEFYFVMKNKKKLMIEKLIIFIIKL